MIYSETEILQAVREWLIGVCPDIREYHNRCMNCGYGFEFCKKIKATSWGRKACTPNESYKDRTIGLCDVLRGIQELFMDKGWEDDHAALLTFDGLVLQLIGHWNLEDDDINHQSPTTIDFIYDLLDED